MSGIYAKIHKNDAFYHKVMSKNIHLFKANNINTKKSVEYF